MYTQQDIKLHDNEGLIAVNKETGETRDIPSRSKKKNNPDMIKFREDTPFTKHFSKAWELLYTQTTPLEYKVAVRLSEMVRMNTNSLQPLDEDYTYQQLADLFNISKSRAIAIFTHLFKLGVYGKFEVYDMSVTHTKYWVFNPYLSMNGKVMSKVTVNLFSNTIYAKM